MPSMQLSRGHKFIIFAAVTCTLLIGLHLSSLSPLAQLQKWRVPTPRPDSDLHDEDGKGHGFAELGEAHSLISSALHATPATTSSPVTQTTQALTTATTHVSPVLPCHDLPGAEDVLVVMRTGATEIKDKLPAHLNTTFQCYPHTVIFSDFAENFYGFEVHDVLKDIPEDIKVNNDDFAHWRHIQENGRVGLDDAELSGEISEESPPTGKGENAGWKLDKWKFLPMINQTLSMYPDKQWYVFVEPDTYLVWSSLLQWVQNIDSSQAYYFGSETMIGDDLFAHGGSAFLISNPAMRKGADLYNSKSAEWDDYVAGHWAGDGVLGVLLKKAGVDLTWSNPMIQGGNPAMNVDFAAPKGETTLWCTPAISYHHLTPSEVRGLWHFEQSYLQSILDMSDKRRSIFAHWGDDMSTVIHHRDTFMSFVLPNITSERLHWNNAADEEVPDSTGAKMDDCRGLCEMKESCLQYTLGPSGCSLGSNPYMGRFATNVTSGWMNERIQAWIDEREHCEGVDGWLAP